MAGMTQHVQDPLLKRMIAQIDRANMDPKVRDSYERIVAAGMKLMWSDGDFFEEERRKGMAAITGPENVADIAANLAVTVMVTVQNQSGQDLMPGMGPATQVFLCNVLQLVEAAKKIQVDEAILADATSKMKDALFAAYKITPEVLDKVQEFQRTQGTSGAAGSSPTAPTATPGGV